MNEGEGRSDESNPGICKEPKHEKKKKHKMETEVDGDVYKADENVEILDRKHKKKQKLEVEQIVSKEEESCGKNKKKKKRKFEETIEDEIKQNCEFGKKRKLKNLENMGVCNLCIS
jgi:hypothetical protein